MQGRQEFIAETHLQDIGVSHNHHGWKNAVRSKIVFYDIVVEQVGNTQRYLC